MPSSFPETRAELLTLRELSALCQVSERTAWQWANDGTAPPALKIGKGTVRYSRRAYEEWIAGGCKPLHGDGGRTDEK